jgi:hypothetical protein
VFNIRILSTAILAVRYNVASGSCELLASRELEVSQRSKKPNPFCITRTTSGVMPSINGTNFDVRHAPPAKFRVTRQWTIFRPASPSKWDSWTVPLDVLAFIAHSSASEACALAILVPSDIKHCPASSSFDPPPLAFPVKLLK